MCVQMLFKLFTSMLLGSLLLESVLLESVLLESLLFESVLFESPRILPDDLGFFGGGEVIADVERLPDIFWRLALGNDFADRGVQEVEQARDIKVIGSDHDVKYFGRSQGVDVGVDVKPWIILGTAIVHDELENIWGDAGQGDFIDRITHIFHQAPHGSRVLHKHLTTHGNTDGGLGDGIEG